MNRPLPFEQMTPTGQRIEIGEGDFPLRHAVGRVALAVITGIEGPSYRPLGAMMVVNEQGAAFGSLSSGCIEADVITHARQAIATAMPVSLRYGRGSPFRDLELPCGGGLDIRILPVTDATPLRAAQARLEARQDAWLTVTPEGEVMVPAQEQAVREDSLHAEVKPGEMQQRFVLRIRPEVRLMVFGKGPEAVTFARLAQAAGYPVEFCAPDPEPGLPTRPLMRGRWPEGLAVDERTAVVMFFHDHDWEEPLLQEALSTPAFYIGAQGSLRVHQARCAALLRAGVGKGQLARIASPFGIVPSTRDARTLAVSVLAHVLEKARGQ